MTNDDKHVGRIGDVVVFVGRVRSYGDLTGKLAIQIAGGILEHEVEVVAALIVAARTVLVNEKKRIADEEAALQASWFERQVKR